MDVELQLTGSGLCHRLSNFTHQLHLLRPQHVPDTPAALNQPYPRRLTAQWSRMNIGENFRIPLNLNGRQLLTLARQHRLHFALSEKIFGIPERQPTKTLDESCSYYSSASSKGPAVWPQLHISYTWQCCSGSDNDAAAWQRRRQHADAESVRALEKATTPDATLGVRDGGAGGGSDGAG